MVIKNDQTGEAELNDMYLNYLTPIQNIYNITHITQGLTLTDFDYTYARSDSFTTSGGYNSSVDSSSNVTNLGDAGYCLTFTIYDNFNDNTIDSDLWSTIISGSSTDPYDGEPAYPDYHIETITETGGKMEVSAYATGTYHGSNAYSANSTADLRSDTSFKCLQVTISGLTVSAGYGSYGFNSQAILRIYLGTTVLAYKTQTANAADGVETSGDLANGVWTLIKTSSNNWNLYKDGEYLRNFSSISGIFRVYAYCYGYSDDATCTAECTLENISDDVEPSGFITLTTHTSPENIYGIYLYADEPGEITYDVSLDGGTTWLDTSIDTQEARILPTTSSGDDVVIKFNFTASDSISPILRGYSYQLW